MKMKYIVAHTLCLLLKPRPKRRVLKKYNRKFRTVSHYLSLSRNNNTSNKEQISNNRFMAAEEAEMHDLLPEETADAIRVNIQKHRHRKLNTVILTASMAAQSSTQYHGRLLRHHSFVTGFVKQCAVVKSSYCLLRLR
jgi:hypothetical protein